MRSKPKRSRQKIALDALVTVLCLAGIAAIFSLPAILNAVREVDFHARKVDELIRALRTGDVETAYRCTDDDFRAKVSLERFRTVVDTMPFQRATDLTVRFLGESSTRAGSASATLKTAQGPLELAFHLYRPVTGMDFLVSQILVDERSLFAAEFGDPR
jgi:hypothetical protein